MTSLNLKQPCLHAIAIILLLLALPGCTEKADTKTSSPVPPGAETIRFQLAIYYTVNPAKDPAISLETQLAARKYHLKQVEKLPEKITEPLLNTLMLGNAQKEYKPPSLESLNHFGQGISREQALALQNASKAFILNFAHPKASALENLRTAYEISEHIARETGGLLWDEETRETYSPDAWHKKRLAAWAEQYPDVAAHTVIHAYKSGEYVRAISLGMSKFGLPDVVVENFSWSMNRSTGNLINLFCQSMIEDNRIARHGDFDLDLRKIRNRKVREQQTETLKSNAGALARLTLKPGRWEEGDPQNRLIELTFDRNAGKDNPARLEKALSELFGWEDSVVKVKHDEELIAASNKAREKLPELLQAFTAGLQPGEYIQVKAPFSVPTGGNEWMWVEVIAWEGDNIKGILRNEPVNIPTLHGGQIVEIDQQDIFDYIRHTPDGKDEGNTTGAIILKMQQESSKQKY